MMQLYDWMMLAELAAAVVWGVWKGVAWQVASLGSVLVSAAVAVRCSAALAPFFSVHFGAQEPWNRWIAMLVLYLATAAGIWILFRLVSNVIDRVKLKEFDRQLGAIFGLAQGVLYCLIITFFAVTLSERARQAVMQSKSGDFLARNIRRAAPVLPQDVRTWLGKYIDELDARLHAPPIEAKPAAPTAPSPPAAPAAPPPGGGASGAAGGQPAGH
jgi:membrane protein required for colicin V production